jgi:hypothetical protein
MRITWKTAGGRTDMIQASTAPLGPFTDIGPRILIPGVGAVTNSYVEVGCATNNPARFYRIRYAP